MKQNQISHVTSYNRYPKIFKEIKEIIPQPSQILSFGCSTNMECETLHELYFPNIKIIGLDISEEVIINNIKKNKYKNIEYYSKVDNITGKSDLIFANSVLCRWPESEGKYTFETFEKTLELIDNLLNKDGYLCIYNSKYLFCETNLFLNKKYEKIKTSYKKTGFVTKYHKNNKKINNNYPFYLFKKTAL
jgi:predicted TPR repeat methyltransferase